MASANDKGTWNTAIERIQTYFGNIVNNASEPKFRRIKKANKIFEKDVSKCIGSEELLKAVGWADEGEFWVLPPDAPVEPLQEALRLFQVKAEDEEGDMKRQADRQRLLAMEKREQEEERKAQLSSQFSADKEARKDPNWKASVSAARNKAGGGDIARVSN
eukprot:CAMPEP_0174291230 /NCGR_PEP_ID=MMETSP0809-20121228/31422_1 /TAXON_ID=73025 ORGANISM="Eutreptiella gymnastica-like, Strain CCMP1594" /NCGR_SAMPLE_ID=MMETSP0809 /ASSEMBLY_ACC=CAM_ASM_000658 /LENGTH=160 /DNA_ID=CAMNT_0015390423 /DNA_START=58 /DNA_END=540 /DNA_ORIENTATION=+